jgi:hypothetical protein
VHKIRRVITLPTPGAHCAPRWGTEFPSAAAGDSSGGVLFPGVPLTVQVCVYRTSATRHGVGNLVRAFTLDRPQTARLFNALKAPGPTSRCPVQRTFAWLIAPNDQAVEVELGGCFRVARYLEWPGVGRGDPDVVRSLLLSGPGAGGIQARAHPRPVFTKQLTDCPTCSSPVYRRDWRSGHLRLSHPDPKGAHLMTRAQIDERNGGHGTTVAALLVTYGQAKGLAPDLAVAPRTAVDPSRKVWLVTSYYHSSSLERRGWAFGHPTKSAAAKFSSAHDSFVVDAATNTETDACRGCAEVPQSNTSWPTAGKPTVSKAQWAAALRRGFKTKTVRVHLEWATEGMSAVDLVWVAYAPHGTMQPMVSYKGTTGHNGYTPHIRPYVGPVGAEIGAFGGPPGGAWTLRPHGRHLHIQPQQSRSISVTLVRGLARKGFRIGLTSYLAPRTITRRSAFEALDPNNPAQVAKRIWLVYLFGPRKTGLAWLIERRDGPYAFVNATTGKVIAPSVSP